MLIVAFRFPSFLAASQWSRHLSNQNSSDRTSNFIPLDIPGLTKFKLRENIKPKPPKVNARCEFFSLPFDWNNIWPAPAIFKHSVVPLPLRQGYSRNHEENGGITPDKYANSELMKIPNFLHLTQNHIKLHCDSLKKFLTKWPAKLKDTNIHTVYPIIVSHKNYVFTGPSIRDPRARVVELSVPMSNLNLSEEARARFLYLAVSTPSGREVCKIDWDKEILKMSSAKCPTVQQNYDYLIFVLTVLTLESKKPLSWDLGPETLAPHEWPQFLWDSSLSRQRLIRFASRLNPPAVVTRSSGDEKGFQNLSAQVDQLPGVPRYRDAISRILRDSFAKNLTARFELPKRPRKKHNPFPGTIADIYGPLLVVPGADEPGPLQEYSDSVISLYGLQPSRFEAYPLKNQSG